MPPTRKKAPHLRIVSSGKKTRPEKPDPSRETVQPGSICINAKCQLRKQAGGCSGSEGCPGFKAR